MQTTNTTPLQTARQLVSVLTFVVTLLLVCAGLRAENVLRMGHGQGAPGDRSIHVIVTGVNDVAVHGYQVAFTYPSEILSLVSVSTIGTHVIEPEFEGPTVNNFLGIGGMGVILEYDEPVEEEALAPISDSESPRILARLTFDVKPGASGGTYPLRLEDGIGSPAKYNRFSTAGTSITPQLEPGFFTVIGEGNVVSMEQKIAFPGSQSVPILAHLQHPDPLAGFQVAVTYDKNALTLRDATYAGTDLDIELGRDGLIELFNLDIDESFDPDLTRATVAVCFDCAAPLTGQTLSPSTEDPPSQSVLKYTFQVADDADANQQYQDIVLSDVPIPGAINNRFIIEDRSLTPAFRHGKIFFLPGALTGRVADTDTGTPVSGARVVTSPGEFEALTDGDGVFLISDIPPGTYTLRVTAAGHYPGRKEDVAVAGGFDPDNAGDVLVFPVPTVQRTFIRGFINRDDRVDISDSIFLLQHLFGGGPIPRCLKAADVNDDNKMDIADSVWLLNYLFGGGLPPRPPFNSDKVDCEGDPTPGGELTCDEFMCLD